MRIQINDRLSLLAKEYFPNDPEVEAIYNTTQGQLETMSMPSYESYIEQEKQMKEMKRVQDSLEKTRKDGVVKEKVEIGADGSLRRN